MTAYLSWVLNSLAAMNGFLLLLSSEIATLECFVRLRFSIFRRICMDFDFLSQFVLL